MSLWEDLFGDGASNDVAPLDSNVRAGADDAPDDDDCADPIPQPAKKKLWEASTHTSRRVPRALCHGYRKCRRVYINLS